MGHVLLLQDEVIVLPGKNYVRLMKIEEKEHIEWYDGLDRKYAVQLKKLVKDYC